MCNKLYDNSIIWRHISEIMNESKRNDNKSNGTSRESSTCADCTANYGSSTDWPRVSPNSAGRWKFLQHPPANVCTRKKKVVKIVTRVKKRCINDAAGSKVIFVPPPCRHNAALWLIGHSRVEPSSR